MPGRQVLGLDLGEAARTVELDDPHPVRVGRERVLRVDQRLVDLARIALIDLAAVLVVLARRAEVVAAYAAVPTLVVELEVEVLRDADARHHSPSRYRIALPWPSMRTPQPAGIAQLLVSDSRRAGPVADVPGARSSQTST